MPRPIDTLHQGDDRVICAWEHDGLVIDPGPAATIPTVLEGLGETEVRAILLTHIHLDHAAGTGTLLQHFPDAHVYVHEIGAPHVIDPSRLIKSATRLYGDAMDRLWGKVLPVPEEKVTALSGGEVVEGMDVIHTPGHAGHHVVYVDRSDGTAYVGDVAGVMIPPGGVTIMPTPPPEIDVEAWGRSIDLVAERSPERLALTHFGGVDDAAAQIEAARESLAFTAGLAEAGDEARFMAEVEARIGAQPDDCAERMRSAMPPDQVWQGLERYWRKRRERETGD